MTSRDEYRTIPEKAEPMGGNTARPTCFGAGIDALARSAGGWPDTAVVFVIGKLNPLQSDIERTQIKLTGAVPVGVRRGGFPKFGKRADDWVAVVTLAQYREAMAANVADPKGQER